MGAKRTLDTINDLNRKELLKVIKESLSERHSITEVSEETNIYKDLALDSLDTVELVMDVEKNLNIKIDDFEVDKFRRVSDILDILETLT